MHSRFLSLRIAPRLSQDRLDDRYELASHIGLDRGLPTDCIDRQASQVGSQRNFVELGVRLMPTRRGNQADPIAQGDETPDGGR